jgi:hypothetical protein
VSRRPPHGLFTLADKSLLMRLYPHLKTALALYEQLRRQHLENNAYIKAIDQLSFGVIILNERGHVVRVNDMASRIMKDGQHLRVVGNCLQAGNPANELAVSAVTATDVVTDAVHDQLHRLGINVFRAERDGFVVGQRSSLPRRCTLEPGVRSFWRPIRTGSTICRSRGCVVCLRGTRARGGAAGRRVDRRGVGALGFPRTRRAAQLRPVQQDGRAPAGRSDAHGPDESRNHCLRSVPDVDDRLGQSGDRRRAWWPREGAPVARVEELTGGASRLASS